MKTWNVQQVEKVIEAYNADHDLGPDAPVTWREERLARLALELDKRVIALENQIKSLEEAKGNGLS